MNLKAYLRGAGIALITSALVLSFSGGQKSKAMTDDEVKARARELGMTEKSEVLLSAEEEVPGVEEEIPEAAEPASEESVAEVPVTESPEVTPPEEPASQESLEDILDEAENTASGNAADNTVADNTASEDTKAEDTAKADTVSDDAAIIEASLEGKQTTDLVSDVTGEGKKKSELLADASETEARSDSAPVQTGEGFASIHVSGGSSSTTVAAALQKAGAVDSATAFDAYLCSKGYDRHLSTGDFRIPSGSSYDDIALILMRRK